MLLEDFTKIRSLALILGFMFLSFFSVAQERVSGRVVSAADGEALPGVTVLIKGTTTGVITDLEGNFTLSANEGDVLTFSYVGFKSLEVPYNGQQNIQARLEIDVKSLSEVVVLGYSEKSQKELSASVVSLDSKELQNVTSPNVQTMLQGKVPGLTVSSPSGQPGVPADIRIRGITSLNIDRPPLFVVDGMIGGNFVPSDVESLTVLKDAAAIGLYGSAGAAGVIIVTTKSGTSGAPTFELSSNVGFKEAVTGNFQMMNSEQLYGAQRQMWGDDNLVSFLNNRPEDLLDEDFNWMDAGFQRAMLQNHSFSMRGGNYGFSVDYFDEEGTFINTNYERINLRGYLKMDLTDRFRIVTDVNAQLSSDKINHYSWFEDVFWNVPWDKPTHIEDGVEVTSGPQYVTNSANGWIGQFKRNFIHSTKYNQLGSIGNDIVWSTRLSYDITNWLSFETRTRLNGYNSKYKEYYAPNTDQGIAMNGVINNSQQQGWGVLSTHFLRFSRNFGKHDLSGFVAHEGGYNVYETLSLQVSNLSSQSISVPSGASNALDWGGNKVETRGYSFISELSYGYDGKYFLTGYWRADASSLFAENTRVGYFPGGSLAWLISEEDMLLAVSGIDLLKLRASYGLVGNSNIDPFLSLPTYNITRQYNGEPGGEPDNPENKQLSWETTKMANIGFDLSLTNGISTSVDLYQKTVEGMILANPQAFSSGYDEKTENVGDMVNRGVEFIIGYTKSFGDFSYTGSFNIAYNENEITRISDVTDQKEFVAGNISQINKVGLPAFTWYMPRWMGVNPDDGSPQWEVIEVDTDGNETRSVTGNYNEATVQPLETALPKINGGFSNTIAYKGLSLSFLITYQTGNAIYHYTRQFVDSDGANTGINLMQLYDGWSRWENPGDNATHPVLNRGGSNGAHFTSSRYIEKGDFIRLRNVSLGYNLPQRFLDWSGIKGASISLRADNLLTLTDFSGMDPDVGLQVQSYSLPGLSYLKYPISKQVVFGLNLKF